MKTLRAGDILYDTGRRGEEKRKVHYIYDALFAIFHACLHLSSIVHHTQQGEQGLRLEVGVSFLGLGTRK